MNHLVGAALVVIGASTAAYVVALHDRAAEGWQGLWVAVFLLASVVAIAYRQRS